MISLESVLPCPFEYTALHSYVNKRPFKMNHTMWLISIKIYSCLWNNLSFNHPKMWTYLEVVLKWTWPQASVHCKLGLHAILLQLTVQCWKKYKRQLGWWIFFKIFLGIASCWKTYLRKGSSSLELQWSQCGDQHPIFFGS